MFLLGSRVYTPGVFIGRRVLSFSAHFSKLGGLSKCLYSGHCVQLALLEYHIVYMSHVIHVTCTLFTCGMIINLVIIFMLTSFYFFKMLILVFHKILIGP